MNRRDRFSDILLSLKLAFAELRHYRLSSLFITLVVAAICLPLIFVASLKEGYISLISDKIESSTQALRIDIAVRNAASTDQFLTDSLINEYRNLEGVTEVVPQKTRTIGVLAQDFSQQDFGLSTTIKTDPDLARFNFEGTLDSLDSGEGLNVIMNKKDLLEELKFDSIPNTVYLTLSRTVNGRREDFSLECNLIGTIEGGPTNTVFVPVMMGKRLERWTLGFRVKEYGLPAAPNNEESLGELVADSCMAVSRINLNDKNALALDAIGMKITRSFKANRLFYNIIQRKDSSGNIGLTELQTVEDALATNFKVGIIPFLPPHKLDLGDTTVTLFPSVTADPRQRSLLSEGNWINHFRSRFEILVPKGLLPVANGSTSMIKATVGNDSINYMITGMVNDTVGYINAETLYRLKQVEAGIATLDLEKGAFNTNEKSPYEDRFLYARIHAVSLQDVLPVTNYFRDREYEIFASSQSQVASLEQVNGMLTNFLLLINLAGGIACVASIFVLMYEAIQRKKNQVGIMRAMGLSKWFITRVYLWQALFYGLGGFLVSFLFFQLVKSLLDSSIGHGLLDLQGLDGNIFSTSTSLTVFFVLGMIVISLMGGWFSTRSVRNIDPADILSDQ